VCVSVSAIIDRIPPSYSSIYIYIERERERCMCYIFCFLQALNEDFNCFFVYQTNRIWEGAEINVFSLYFLQACSVGAFIDPKIDDHNKVTQVKESVHLLNFLILALLGVLPSRHIQVK